MSNKREYLMEKSVELILTDAHGIHIPQIFCQNIREEVLEQQDKEIKQVIEKLAKENSLEHEWYWEYWDTVLSDLEYTIEGVKYSIYQSGDLWEINHRYYDQLTEEEIEKMWV